MIYPLDQWLEKHNKTNLFGQSDVDMRKYYVKTWTHVGADFAVPSGTPIYAPCDGEMIVSQLSAPKGNVGVFEFTYNGVNWGFEICHLKSLPKLGKYKQGDIIAYTGNTGSATTGAHLHCVLHRDCAVTKNYSLLSQAGATGGANGRAKFLELVKQGKLTDPFNYFKENVSK